jgi:peptidoglycan hydrolase-like protein with peptidoglycan-binding domain
MTGSGGVAWTDADWVANPSAVRIDQSPVLNAIDETADVLDVESGAATPGEAAAWAKAARLNYLNNIRPGQRIPAIYVNQSNKTAVVNSLVAGGVTSGVGLWLADYNYTRAGAAAAIEAASGPFPIIGIQYSDQGGGGLYDLDEFAALWLSTQSGVKGNTVAAGSSGPAVVALQAGLNASGSKLTPDGLFGLITQAATIAFQKLKGLTQDGVAGPLTWAALVVPPPPPTSLTQHGTVHSDTTGGNAAVMTTDGGWTWLYGGAVPSGAFRYQTGTVHSITTGADAMVVSDDGGGTWHYAGTPSS